MEKIELYKQIKEAFQLKSTADSGDARIALKEAVVGMSRDLSVDVGVVPGGSLSFGQYVHGRSDLDLAAIRFSARNVGLNEFEVRDAIRDNLVPPYKDRSVDLLPGALRESHTEVIRSLYEESEVIGSPEVLFGPLAKAEVGKVVNYLRDWSSLFDESWSKYQARMWDRGVVDLEFHHNLRALRSRFRGCFSSVFERD